MKTLDLFVFSNEIESFTAKGWSVQILDEYGPSPNELGEVYDLCRVILTLPESEVEALLNILNIHKGGSHENLS